jgi:hypothetical protein
MECIYCKNKFTTKTSLNTHQKTAKYCLKLRGDVLSTKHTCNGCSKTFCRKYEYERHMNICKSDPVVETYKLKIHDLEKINEQYKFQLETKDIRTEELDKTIQDQKHQIKDLQNKLENIAISAVSRPTTSNKTQINNYIQQMKPVTDEYMEDNVKHLTIDHIMKGAEGYAQYALEYPLKDRLICVDYARRKVKFKNNEGELITDPEMSNLATKFFNSIKDKNKELIIECGKKLKENFGDELDTIVKIFDYKTGVERSSDGEKSEFHHDFVRQVCSRTIKE